MTIRAIVVRLLATLMHRATATAISVFELFVWLQVRADLTDKLNMSKGMTAKPAPTQPASLYGQSGQLLAIESVRRRGE